MSDKTCGNCGYRESCLLVTKKESCGCSFWQPIPVAATDAPEPTGMHVNGRNRSWTSDGEVTYLREAIAKRDDLIRRMAEMIEFQIGAWGRFDEMRALISESNELLGDITNK